MTKKIMVVDDEENILELVKAILEKEKFSIITAKSGKECLDLLKKVKPDLILMDLMMPSMTGKETTKKIRENPKTKNIKIIFLTVARLSEVGMEELDKLNVSDYITKPFDNEDLVRRVKRAIGE
ncbi:MAG: response regulator [Candidatus Aenigmatarchaeota archaeon]